MLNHRDPMILNAIVIAFDKRARFEPYGTEITAIENTCRSGTLIVPIEEGIADFEKPGWIVDGQQRMAAIRDAAISSFPICVTAFVAEGEQEQKAQFILVNSTKPLPKGLIYELLQTTQMT